jgi:hypothetical protein
MGSSLAGAKGIWVTCVSLLPLYLFEKKIKTPTNKARAAATTVAAAPVLHLSFLKLAISNGLHG